MKMDRKYLLGMKLGQFVELVPAGPEGMGYLSEIHRVLGGWIYVFKHTRQGTTNYAVGLTSTFVPEQIDALTRKWGTRQTDM